MTEEELLKLLLCSKANRGENRIIFDLIKTKNITSSMAQKVIDRLDKISKMQKDIIFKIGVS